MRWLKQPYINLTEICRRLYGSDSPTMRSKLRKKVYEEHGLRLLPDELTKLEEIRKNIISELRSK